MRDIAAHCGVSIWTVSLALRHDPRVSSTTAAHVQAIAQELGYDPAVHQAARRLVSRRLGKDVMNNVIGLLLPPHFQAANYFAYASLGVLDVLALEGYGVLTSYLPVDDGNTLPRFPAIYTRGEVDGVIGAGYFLPQRVLQALRGNMGFGERPVITLIVPQPGCSSVTTDDRAGAYAATAHLLELGHRHILHFLHQASVPLANRLAGVCQAMQDHGVDPATHLHYLGEEVFFGRLDPPHHLRFPDPASTDPDDTVARYYLSQLVAYLRAHPEVTAILGQNDPTARRVWYMLQEHGIRVPEEISLIGFDDTDGIPDEFGRNVLTSVRLPLEAVGQEAARMLIRQLASGQKELEHIVLPTELVVRHSTAPPRVTTGV